MKNAAKSACRSLLKVAARLGSPFDRAYLADDIPESHVQNKWEDYVNKLNKGEGLRILEIGSREVTGPSTARERFAKGKYVGFDYYPGRNVDVVGDVHRLSSYFSAGEKFDVIYTIASFEHFAMPWIVAEEISKMLAVNGILFVTTHFSFKAHERPWNFFQFSDMGLRVLFSSLLGFECIEAGMSNPLVGRFSALADKPLRYVPVRGLYCSSAYLGKKVRDVPSFDWHQASIDEIVVGTTYPKPKQ
jgi:hypothetical protein